MMRSPLPRASMLCVGLVTAYSETWLFLDFLLINDRASNKQQIPQGAQAMTLNL